MAARKTGLGRGLSELLDDIKSPVPSSQTLPIADISANTGQPRRRFDEAALGDLTESVSLRGVLQPILVRPIGNGRYEIVAGERRWRAAQAAGLHEIPVIVRDLDDGAALEIAIVENIQRADLNAIEEAQGYRRLIEEFGHTQDALGKIVGKSRSHVANLLRLLELPAPVRDAVIEGTISMGHARAMLAAPDPASLLGEVVAGGLSVRDTEARAARPKAGPKPKFKYKMDYDPDIFALERRLTETLGMSVAILANGGAGRVEIGFASLDQLDLVCQRLTGGRV